MTHLSLVDVRAVIRDLRVVQKKDCRVDAERSRDRVALVILLHNIRGGAVLAGRSKADRLPRHEIVATRVDCRIDGGELESEENGLEIIRKRQCEKGDCITARHAVKEDEREWVDN